MARQLLGVVHLRPLPSSARGTAFAPVLEAALADGRALAEGGVDGMIVENLGDAPFHRGTRGDLVPPDVPAALAVIARELAAATGLPIGINCLRNDAVAAIGAAVVAGARWVRVNVLSGTAVTDQGLIDGEPAQVADYARRVGWKGQLLADLWVKHAAPLAAPPLAVAARDLAMRSGAAGILVTGAQTGVAPTAALLAEVREAIGAFPLWLGSGLDHHNAAELWPLCDGAIVGTAFKHGGEIQAPVDPARVRGLRTHLAG